MTEQHTHGRRENRLVALAQHKRIFDALHMAAAPPTSAQTGNSCWIALPCWGGAKAIYSPGSRSSAERHRASEPARRNSVGSIRWCRSSGERMPKRPNASERIPREQTQRRSAEHQASERHSIEIRSVESPFSKRRAVEAHASSLSAPVEVRFVERHSVESQSVKPRARKDEPNAARGSHASDSR